MQDLAYEFSKIFRGDTRTLTAGGGDPLPHPTPSPAFGPVLGPKPWSPSTFQPWFHAPLATRCMGAYRHEQGGTYPT